MCLTIERWPCQFWLPMTVRGMLQLQQPVNGEMLVVLPEGVSCPGR